MTEDIAVLNDNQMSLTAWLELLGERALGFSHPRQLIYKLSTEPQYLKSFRYYILDRQCSSMYDVVDDGFVEQLKAMGAKGLFLLASVLHPRGDTVKGFDYSLGPVPIELAELQALDNKQCPQS